MPTPIDPKRLPGLRAALASFGEDERASQQQLADLYGVASSRLSTLIKQRFPDFPPNERRDDKTHWYPARAAVQSMIRYMEDQAHGRTRHARRRTEVMGAVAGVRADLPDEPQLPTPADIDKLASAQTRLWRLRKDQGLYTLTSEVQTMARGVNAMFSREIMNLVNELDPNGQMTIKQRANIKERCREMVTKMHDQLGRFLEIDDDAGYGGGASSAERGSGGNHPRRRARQRA